MRGIRKPRLIEGADRRHAAPLPDLLDDDIDRVVKVKNIMGDVMDAKVCVKPIGAKSACKWVNAGAGNWADPKVGF